MQCTHLESLCEHLDDTGLRELLRDVRRMTHQKPQNTEAGRGGNEGGGAQESGLKEGTWRISKACL